jgi:microcystin degradation protein MlrC
MLRVAVGGVEHETTQLLASVGLKTEWAEFEGTGLPLLRGAEVAALGKNNTVVDGFVAGCAAQDLEVVPLCYAKARTGGPVDRATLQRLVAEVIDPLRAQLPVDGVLLSLHGAFCAEENQGSWREDDADGAILAAVRELVGDACPVFSVHDLHCNISQKMVDASDVLVVERTYPHVDMAERALHAAGLMARTLRGEIRPTMAWCSLPMFWAAKKMLEKQEPFRSLVQRLEDLSPSTVSGDWPSAAANLRSADAAPPNGRKGVLSASVGVGYQWADSPTLGASVIIITDNDTAAAQHQASSLAGWVWDCRDDWLSPSLSVDDAIALGEVAGAYPVVLADQGDNTGGGAPGDATHILRLFIEREFTDAVVLYVVDPEAAAIATAAGCDPLHPRYPIPQVGVIRLRV